MKKYRTILRNFLGKGKTDIFFLAQARTTFLCSSPNSLHRSILQNPPNARALARQPQSCCSAVRGCWHSKSLGKARRLRRLISTFPLVISGCNDQLSYSFHPQASAQHMPKPLKIASRGICLIQFYTRPKSLPIQESRD